METQILDIFTNISVAGAVALIGYFLIKDVIAPLINYLINKKNGVGQDLASKVNKIEVNHLGEINRRLGVLENNDIRIWQSLDNIKDEMSKVRERLSGLEAKIK